MLAELSQRATCRSCKNERRVEETRLHISIECLNRIRNSGWDKRETIGRVSLFGFTDESTSADGQNDPDRRINFNPLPQFGILNLGATEFTRNVLRSQDFIDEFLKDPEQPMQNWLKTEDSNSAIRIERLKQVIPEIEGIAKRFNIQMHEGPFTFVSDPMIISEATRLAKLLIYGTSWYSRGEVGGEIKICSVTPLSGVKCESVGPMTHPFKTRFKPNI
jgi:hypothetical protein